MVRNYVRKTQKGAGFAYTSESLRCAVEDVKNGNRTTRGAAMFYGIPRSTVKHYVLGTRGKGSIAQEGRGGGGVVSYLSSAEEEEIVNCIKTMEKNGFGLSREDVLDLVQLYIRQNKLQTRFKDQRPGTDWFISFRKRHKLSIKKAQVIEYTRCEQTNPWVIYDFFDKITDVIKTLKLEDKPNQIFNCDETSFCHDPSKTKIVGAVGTQSKRKISSSGKENTTVLLCSSAGGKTMPLLCVFKGKYVMENWIENQDDATRTAVAASERGWMETTLFYNWFKDVFLQNIGNERPVLLIYDGHVTHISTKLIQLARANEVTIMKLPPHTTHILQPLDVAVFRGLKSKWDKELCKWQRANPRKKIPKSEFIALLTRVAQEIPPVNILNGFKTTGIYDPDVQGPNKNAIPQSIFNPSDLAKYKKNLNFIEQPEITSLEAEHTTMAKPSIVSAVLQNIDTPLDEVVDNEIVPTTSLAETEEQQEINLEPKQAEYQATEANASVIDTTVLQEMDTTSDNVVDHKNVATTSFGDKNQSNENRTSHQTFEDVLLDLLKKDRIKPQVEKKRKRVVNNCEIITTDEYLRKKEAEEKEKIIKVKKQKSISQPKKLNKNIDEKHSTTNGEISSNGTKKQNFNQKSNKVKDKNIQKAHLMINSDDSSSDDSDTYSVQESDHSLDVTSSSDDESTIDIGDHCVIKVFANLNRTNSAFRLYVGKIIKKVNAGYEVKFFKRHNQTMKFIETDDELFFITQADIVRKLSRPVTSSSARYTNMISFTSDLTDLTNIN